MYIKKLNIEKLRQTVPIFGAKLTACQEIDCKTVGFSSKSVKKSVKRGVIVVRARSARA